MSIKRLVYVVLFASVVMALEARLKAEREWKRVKPKTWITRVVTAGVATFQGAGAGGAIDNVSAKLRPV